MTDTGLTFQACDAMRWFLRPFDMAVICNGHIALFSNGKHEGGIPPARAAAFIQYLTRYAKHEWEADCEHSVGTYRRVQ